EHVRDVPLCQRKHQLADTARCKRICRDAAGWSVDRPASSQRFRQRWGLLGFDADQMCVPRVPAGDAADQSAAANCDENRIEIGHLNLQLEAQCSLPEKSLDLVEGVNG